MRQEFRCLKCGECCKHLVGSHFGMPITRAEYQTLSIVARHHGIDLAVKPLVPGIIGAEMYQMTRERCPLLASDNMCRAYAVRPTVCRMFPLHPSGLSNCTFLNKYLDKHLPPDIQIQFPETMKMAVYDYMRDIQPVLKASTIVVDVNRGLINRNTIRPIQPGMR